MFTVAIFFLTSLFSWFGLAFNWLSAPFGEKALLASDMLKSVVASPFKFN